MSALDSMMQKNRNRFSIYIRRYIFRSRSFRHFPTEKNALRTQMLIDARRVHIHINNVVWRLVFFLSTKSSYLRRTFNTAVKDTAIIIIMKQCSFIPATCGSIYTKKSILHCLSPSHALSLSPPLFSSVSFAYALVMWKKRSMSTHFIHITHQVNCVFVAIVAAHSISSQHTLHDARNHEAHTRTYTKNR